MRARVLWVIGSLGILLLLLIVFIGPAGGPRTGRVSAAHLNTSFTAPYNISNSASPDYANSQHPRAVWTSDDFLHAAWMEGAGVPYRYGAAYTHGQGTTWELWHWTGQHDNPAYANPGIAVDSSGNVHVVWAANLDVPYDIYYAVKSGGLWSSPVNLTEGLGDNRKSSFYPTILIDSQDRVWAGWQTAISDLDTDLYVCTKPAGGSWGPPTTLLVNPTDDLNLEWALGPNDVVHAVWRTRIGTQFDVLYSKYEGGLWSPPVNLSATSSQSYYPHVAADGAGNVFVVWSDEYSGRDRFDILFRRFDGTEWLPIQYASHSPKALYPGLAADGCNLYASWTDYRDNPSRPEIYFSYSTDCGSTWVGDENVSRNGSSSFWPDITTGLFGIVNIFWQDIAPGQWDIFYSKGTVLTVTPTPSIIPTITPTPILTPQVYVPNLARNWYTTAGPIQTPAPPILPTAAFTSSAPVCDGMDVVFTNTGSLGVPPADQFLWGFGDGITSTLENTSHLYTGPGTYTVTFELCNVGGCDVVSGTAVVWAPPTASFSYTTELLTATFTNTSQSATSYLWSFGDGITSTLTSPVHTYAGMGTFTVTLVATGSCGTDAFTAAVTVSLRPVAGFSSDAPVCLGEPVAFTNTSQWADSYLWAFGDGGTSTETNPIHLYAAAGLYSVTLTATNAFGSDAVTGAAAVLPPPTASFTYVTDLLTVTFTNSSQNATSYLWDFGDGITSTVTSPVHTYAGMGVYTVTLAATGDCGTDVSTLTVTVIPPAVAGFASNTPVCLGEPVVFTNTSQWADSYLWAFGDGGTSTLTNPLHLYAGAGAYTVTLDACNGAGCDNVTGTVVVLPLPTASFTYVTDLLTVTFTNSSQNATSYLWDFGDGITSTLTSPVHTYGAAGTYTVTLWATGDCGTAQSAVAVTVSTPPPALVIAFPTGYPCWQGDAASPIRAEAYVADASGSPVSDAVVSVTIAGNTWLMLPLSGGYYGGAGGCWDSLVDGGMGYDTHQDVTITASKAGYIGANAAANTAVNPACSICP